MSISIVEFCAGVDIGGTHICIGCLDRGSGTLLQPPEELLIDCTALGPAALLDAIDEVLAKAVAAVSRNSSSSLALAAIGIGCPGQSRNGVLVAASNLPLVRGFALAQAVSNRHGGVPTLLMNDADAAVCAEVWGPTSAAHYTSMRNIAMLTLGTGIGCGLVLNRALYQGSNGLIEAGHMIVSHHYSYSHHQQEQQQRCKAEGNDESALLERWYSSTIHFYNRASAAVV